MGCAASTQVIQPEEKKAKLSTESEMKNQYNSNEKVELEVKNTNQVSAGKEGKLPPRKKPNPLFIETDSPTLEKRELSRDFSSPNDLKTHSSSDRLVARAKSERKARQKTFRERGCRSTRSGGAHEKGGMSVIMSAKAARERRKKNRGAKHRRQSKSITPPNIRHFLQNNKDRCHCCEMDVDLHVWCIHCDKGGKVVSLCKECDIDVHGSGEGKTHKTAPYGGEKPAPVDLQNFADSLMAEMQALKGNENGLGGILDSLDAKQESNQENARHNKDTSMAITELLLGELFKDVPTFGEGEAQEKAEEKLMEKLNNANKKEGPNAAKRRGSSIKALATLDEESLDHNLPSPDPNKCGEFKRMIHPRMSALLEPLEVEEIAQGGYVYEMEADEPKLTDALEFGAGKIIEIACGGKHCGALSASGLLFMWGSNNDGQLGLGVSEKFVAKPTLIVLPPVEDKLKFLYATNIACGYRHTAAATKSGIVFTWGCGMYGILGHGSDLDYSTPKHVKGIPKSSGVVSLACGQYNTGAVIRLPFRGTDLRTNVYTWGANESGQIGDGTTGPALEPVKVDGKHFGHPVICISFGNRHAAACCENGKVYTWGKNEFGQLGYLSRTEDGKGRVMTPKLVKSLCTKHKQQIIQVACGERHTSALSCEGEIWGWGSGETHQVGIFDNEDFFYPVKVKTLAKEEVAVESISVGASVSCCVSLKGEVFVWGYSVESPIPKRVKEISSEFFRAARTDADGKLLVLSGSSQDVYRWTIPDNEEDGEVTEEKKEEKDPMERIEELRGKRCVEMDGDNHFLVATATGEVFAWGENAYGQLGLGDDKYCDFPVKVELREPIVAVAVSECHSIALSSSGKMYAWGSGEQGRLGLGHDRDAPIPSPVAGLDSVVVRHIAAGKFNSGAVGSKGGVYIWGAGNSRQLGFKGEDPSYFHTHMKPFKIETLSGISCHSLAIGSRHVLVATTDGKVWSWGNNDFGQLGYEQSQEDLDSCDNWDYYCPGPKEVKVSAKGKVSEVYAGTDISFALMQNGKIYGWGSGETHQLANEDNGFDDEFYPVEIKFMMGAKPIKMMSLAGTNCVAICEDGLAYGWGWDIGETPTLVKDVADLKSKVSIVAVGVSDVVYAC
ncbi:hypothetical protein AAMO2058_000639500 [Amorphochlora amoebiformis]